PAQSSVGTPSPAPSVRCGTIPPNSSRPRPRPCKTPCCEPHERHQPRPRAHPAPPHPPAPPARRRHRGSRPRLHRVRAPVHPARRPARARPPAVNPMSATSPAPAPTRPRLTPPRPRLVADSGVAALAFIAFGLPSILLAPQPWHVEFFLFGTQSLLSADSPGTIATVIRTTINLAAAIGMPVAVIWRASKPVHSTAVVAALALAHFFTGVLLMPVDFLIFLSLYSLTIYASSAASRIGLFTALFGGLLVTISIAPIWG